MSTQSEKLVADVKVLVNDAEELVKATASQTGEKIVELRDRVKTAMSDLKPQLVKVQTAVVDRAKSTATSTDNYVHENPWYAIGIATGVGLIIGLLISRNR